MSIIQDIINSDIEPALKKITIANGFSVDANILQGFLVHYVSALNDAHTPVKFPCVAFQPDSETLTLNHSRTQAKCSRVVKIIGAVSVKDPSLVTDELNNLLYDVRKSLVLDAFKNKSKAIEFEIGAANFNLPDSMDQYAYFETSITINYIETWI